jgi:branched-chain amino acid transport system substrate-binding protein
MGLKTVFRVIGRDDRQGIAAAKLIAERWPGGRIAVIDDGQLYGKDLADEVRRGLASRNIPLALSLTYAPDAADYTSIIDGLKTARADVLYVGGYAADLGLILREVRQAGLAVQVVCGDPGNDRTLREGIGAASDGLLFTYGADFLRLRGGMPLVASVKETAPNLTGNAILAYTAVQVWAEAAAKARSTEGAAIAARLHGGRFDTVIGPVAFDAAGDVTGPAGEWMWYRIHGGKVEPASTRP